MKVELILCSYLDPLHEAGGFRNELADAFDEYCKFKNVTVHRGSVLDVDCNAVVSPANSFGFMDGGIDGLYTKTFGIQVQQRTQDMIQEHYSGEMLVGQADVVGTDSKAKPYLVVAPTMRVPMILPENTVNPYLAMKAVCRHLNQYGLAGKGYTKVKFIGSSVRVAVPGFGTGVGRVRPATCAKQFRAAISEIFEPKIWNFPTSWLEAQTNHQLLYSDDTRDLQRHL